MSAAPPGSALVIGNATYATLPALPGCTLSAHGVAAALHRLGFHVIEREDAGLGAVDGALGRFSARLAAHPGAPAFVYLCGYGAALNGRGFFLPVSASIARSTDLLTQGLLLASVIGSLRGVEGAGAVAMLDLAARPGAPAAEGVGIDTAALPGPVGLLAARDPATGQAPTPLAAALITGLNGPEVQSGTLIARLRAALGEGAGRIVALHPPGQPLLLAGSPPPPAAATSKPAAVPVRLPDEADMTDAQRMQAQTALARLGYYDGKIDGVFGPDTRAAIRRYQFERHAPMTGTLTADQATHLVTATPR